MLSYDAEAIRGLASIIRPGDGPDRVSMAFERRDASPRRRLLDLDRVIERCRSDPRRLAGLVRPGDRPDRISMGFERCDACIPLTLHDRFCDCPFQLLFSKNVPYDAAGRAKYKRCSI